MKKLIGLASAMFACTLNMVHADCSAENAAHPEQSTTEKVKETTVNIMQTIMKMTEDALNFGKDKFELYQAELETAFTKTKNRAEELSHEAKDSWLEMYNDLHAKYLEAKNASEDTRHKVYKELVDGLDTLNKKIDELSEKAKH